MAGKGGPMRKKAPVPPPAKFAVKCDKSPSGKHRPQSYSTKDSNGRVIHYKACTECGLSLK